MVERDTLVSHLDALLAAATFRDYAPNGLQVEGRPNIRRLITGVTASQALIDAAVAAQADAILVHHGYFWRNEPQVLTGVRRRRVHALLKHDISLLAYHLPLDAHPDLGNNAGLGRVLEVMADGRFGEQSLGWIGNTDAPLSLAELVQRLQAALDRQPLVLGDQGQCLRRVAWCTGGAQGLFGDAIAAGADVYVTGEVSEQCTHMARESGVSFISAGHHATERFGVQSLAGHLAERFAIECRYVDIDNPV